MNSEYRMLESLFAGYPERFTEREKDILLQRAQDFPTPRAQLAAKYGVSASRIRQVELRARETVNLVIRAHLLEYIARSR